jgi:DNA-binding XRE family transcriptional regulator
MIDEEKNTTEKKTTTDAIEILHRRYFEGKPERLAALEEERANAEIAQSIYDLRQEAGITQQELANLVGTSRSVIVQLEDADYDGHLLAMLRRIAAALNKKVRIEFVPMETLTKNERAKTK